jgi:4-hydroxy-tetrahydrodipicolinate synthase
VVLAGTTGEAPTLSDDEKLELFRRAKAAVGNDCLIIAGTGSNDTVHAVELSREAQAAGADALLVVSPYYNKATAEGLAAHYVAIAHAVSIPLIIYNVPARTGQDIPVSVYHRLSRIPNIAGVKEASTDVTKITRIRRACGPNFGIWSGNDDLALATVALGGQGVISVTSNAVPRQVCDWMSAALDGDLDTAAALGETLLPLNDLLFCEVNPIPIKAAMEILGYDCGGCRLPLTSLSKENRSRLEALLRT